MYILHQILAGHAEPTHGNCEMSTLIDMKSHSMIGQTLKNPGGREGHAMRSKGDGSRTIASRNNC